MVLKRVPRNRHLNDNSMIENNAPLIPDTQKGLGAYGKNDNALAQYGDLEGALDVLREINPQWEKFLFAYVGEAQFSPMKAAELAGYAPHYGYAITSDPRFRHAYQCYRQEASFYEIADGFRLLKKLTDIIEDRTTTQVALPTGTVEISTPVKDQAKALELLARFHGLYDSQAPNVHVGNRQIVVDFDETTKETLAKEGKFDLEKDDFIDGDDRDTIDVTIED